jgi:uncharacterized protein YodC (DUF2158 family)
MKPSVTAILQSTMGLLSRIFYDLKSRLTGPLSRFNVGDSVQLKDGGPLMVVIEVFTSRKMPEPLIHCKWYESETKETRTNIFHESALKLFDWYSNPSEN